MRGRAANKMAEAKTTQQKTENKTENATKYKQTCPNPTFNTFDIFCVLFSFGTFVADLSTDLILVIEYSRCGHIAWAVSTLLLMLLPASVIQLFSLRWHKLDEQISTSHYISHACLLGIAQRYYYVLQTGLEARSSGDVSDYQRLYQQQSDLCMLHLFESFMESAPQLILQLYVMLNVGEWHSWTGLSASASLCSLAWAIAAYTRAMRRVHPEKNKVRWPGLLLQATWRGGMLAARISALLLFALAFHYWLLVVMGFHWIAMTTWVVMQDTDFCATVWEERIYNGIVGIIYCFSFFNICEGRSRKRVFSFYLVIVTQNVACFILVVSLKLITSIEIIIVSAVLILGGTIVGLCSMTLYYTKFHPAGPIPCCPLFGDLENQTKDSPEPGSKTTTLRSLKHMRGCSLTQTEENSFKNSPHSDDGCTDKKLLLENWIARSGSPMFASAPISQDPDNSLEDIEFHTVANSADSTFDKGIINEGFKSTEKEDKHKKRNLCSPTELGFKLSQLNSENVELNNSKRRGIYSSDQLVIDLNDLTKIDALTNSEINLNDDVKLKRRPIYSVGSALNSYGSELNLKNILTNKLIKMCSDDKSVCSSGTLKPEEYMEMSSEVLSAHDYENICAVNIAREKWGLRSWEGYTDIETFLHDDSTVRDRRRDTLTSTITGTSSEISSSDTAGSSPNRRPRPLRSRQDDYLDTLIYDLVDCEQEIESNVFTAKPIVIDQYGVFFHLGSTLEPIEELEEPLTPDKAEILRKPRSALVATIDEIRRGTDTDSPRHVYYRTENIWDDLDLIKKDTANKNITNNKNSPPKQPVIIKKLTDSDEKLNIFNKTQDNHRTGNKPRRKFSLLREKFEPKLKNSEESLNSSLEIGSTVNLIDDLKSAKYTPPVITKIMQWNNVIRNQNKDVENPVSEETNDSSTNLRDKRTVFLKQVLSPPKIIKNKRQFVISKEINSK